MTDKDPSIIWPAPGFPALLEPPNSHFDLIVACRNSGCEFSRAWAQAIALRDRAGEKLLPLVSEEIAAADPGLVSELAGGFAALPQAAGLHFVRVRLRIPANPPASCPPSPRTVQLLDVCVNGVVERPRCVALFREPGTTLNLAFASDLHAAAIWDEVAAAVDRHAPELAGVLLHPRRLLNRFIDEANALAAGGRLDLVVLGGDLVDHVQIQPRGDGRNGDTNVSRLLGDLARLEVPTLMIPGNHDFRGFPRRLRSSGMEGVGLSWKQGEALLRKTGLWEFWPLNFRDLDALCTTNAGGPALSDHLTHLAPATDYCCRVRGLRLLLASTGCDMLVRWKEVEPPRWGLAVRGLKSTRYHPDSEGFSEGQIGRLRGGLQAGGGAALFFHAPLLAAPTEVRIEERLASLHPGPQEALADRVAFECRMQRAGFRTGVSFKNPGMLLREIAAAAGPVATFSGHAHRATAIEVNRRTMRARSIDPNQTAAGPDIFSLLTAPALGQVVRGGTQRPGYLLARFSNGALTSLRQCSLETRP